VLEKITERKEKKLLQNYTKLSTLVYPNLQSRIGLPLGLVNKERQFIL
jgi:hypothetical protein